MKEKIQSIIDDLMVLVDNCKKNAELSEKDKMPTASATCTAMAFAYLNAASKLKALLIENITNENEDIAEWIGGKSLDKQTYLDTHYPVTGEVNDGWVRVEDRLPEQNKIVTIKYYKHKKSNWSGNTGVFITQGYYVEKDHKNFNGEFLYKSREWYDYTDRLIWDISSKSKNKVIYWTDSITT